MKTRLHLTVRLLACALGVIVFSARNSFSQISVDSANRFVLAVIPAVNDIESSSSLGLFDKALETPDFPGDLGHAAAAQTSNIQLTDNFLTIAGSGFERAIGFGNSVSSLLLDFTLSSPAPLLGEASAVRDGLGNADIFVRLINLSSSSTIFAVSDEVFSPNPTSTTLDEILPAGSYRLTAKAGHTGVTALSTWTLDLQIGSTVPDGGATAILAAVSFGGLVVVKKRSKRFFC